MVGRVPLRHPLERLVAGHAAERRDEPRVLDGPMDLGGPLDDGLPPRHEERSLGHEHATTQVHVAGCEMEVPASCVRQLDQP